MQKSDWGASAAYGYAPHKTPSGAFDPEVFAPPEQQSIIPIDAEVPVHRTESLGLKCLGDKPLLVPQLSTDSVFSREESETIDEYPEPSETPTPSVPIGIRRVKQEDTETAVSSSAPEVDSKKTTENPSMSSLPDRLACEAMATQMTALVLNDEKEQIKTNTLYQKIVDSNPTADLESASEQMNVLYKTELCRSWQFGQCKYNERCLFAHGEHELKPLKKPRHNKYKTELCITFHTFGFCPYATRCNFVHELDEHRPAKHSVPSLYKTRLCRTFMEKQFCPYGDKCDFAHGTNDLSYDITKHPKYRTKLCRSYVETGTCVYGERCCFAHEMPSKKEKKNSNESNETDTDETPTKKRIENKQVCRRWKYSGKCSFGDQCIFYHGTPGKQRANQKRG